MNRISITEKLILYFVSLGIVVIVIIGSYSYFFTKKALLSRTFDQLTSLRLEKKNRIEQFFTDRERDITIISKSEEAKKIIEILNAKILSTDKINKQLFNSNLNKFLSNDGYYQKLYLINQTDYLCTIRSSPTIQSNQSDYSVLTNQNLKNICDEIKRTKQTIIQDLSKSNLLIYIGTAILDDNKNIEGIVVLEIPVTAINKIMFGYSKNNGLGESGETYLVGNDSLMRSNSRFKENAVFNIKVASESVKHALRGETGNKIVRDYRNVSCLSSFSNVDIKGLNWVILAEINEQEAMIPVNSIRNSILLLSLIIAASVFIVAYFVSKRISLPIKKLQKASEQISIGNYNIKLNVSSSDEIGLLTEAFNNMSLQLKKQSIEIEEEKTKRLRSIIDGQEMERQRLSRDMHDSLGQSLLAVKMKLEHAKNSKTEKSQELIIETQELLRNTINEIKNISNDLMPPVLEAFGIEKGLQNLCKTTTSNTGIEIDFLADIDESEIDPRLQIYLYRISQEAINNITKHSNASHVKLNLSGYAEFIFLSIADNGKGFDIENIDMKSNGIANIKERVKLFKGEVTFCSSAENGTQIDIKIPIIKYE
ncbi:MAG: histidine kinase [Bacteroidetes bacterium]|nr:histidine kinase [Bacteroidota bacterium]